MDIQWPTMPELERSNTVNPDQILGELVEAGDRIADLEHDLKRAKALAEAQEEELLMVYDSLERSHKLNSLLRQLVKELL